VRIVWRFRQAVDEYGQLQEFSGCGDEEIGDPGIVLNWFRFWVFGLFW
jgi:hypothetical protein